MVDVSNLWTDPTLDAMDEQLEAKSKREKRRPYLGMSSIGRPCAREQWYGFRWVARSSFSAHTLKLFEDGHRIEDVYAARLRAIPGVTLITSDPETGRQIGFEDFGGHFKGHMDGDIRGLLQAPVTPHVWEHKATNETKFKKLKKLRDTLGEKHALREWDATYYGQAVTYMDYGGYTRHYMTCSTPGGRDDTSVRTNSDPVEAQRLRDQAERIIFNEEPPAKIGDATFYICRWCDYSGICHEGQPADRNCRTCMHSTALRKGGWWCERHEENLSYEMQEAGCVDHRYNPHVIAGELIDGNEQENWTLYRLLNGEEWRDGS